MASLEHFELRDGYATFRPEGPTSLEDIRALLEQAMKACQEHNVTRLIYDVTKLSHKPLTVTDRFEMFDGLARVWDRRIRVAWVVRQDQMDPAGFGVMVAANRGLGHERYLTEAEALEWLLWKA